MPYRKKRYRRSKYMRNTGMKRIQRQLKAINSRAELKYYDDSAGSCTAEYYTGNWTRHCFTGPIVQGTTTETRVGNKIKLKRLFIRGYMVNNRGTPVDSMIRLIIFRAKQPNNALQTEDLLFQDGADINTPRMMEHKKRFKVYFDQTFTMKASTDVSTQIFLPVKINIPLNSVATYNGVTGGYTDMERNGVYLLICSTTNTGSANVPSFQFYSRVTYYDS